MNKRIQIFPTVGDELQLLTIAQKSGVELEIGGSPECDGFYKGIENRRCWFTAYLYGNITDIAKVWKEYQKFANTNCSPDLYKGVEI